MIWNMKKKFRLIITYKTKICFLWKNLRSYVSMKTDSERIASINSYEFSRRFICNIEFNVSKRETLACFFSFKIFTAIYWVIDEYDLNIVIIFHKTKKYKFKKHLETKTVDDESKNNKSNFEMELWSFKIIYLKWNLWSNALWNICIFYFIWNLNLVWYFLMIANLLEKI
jgi:hypothetical protein